MNVHSLISHDFPVLSLQDSGDKALQLMHEYRVFHLPVVDRSNYIALISEDDILDWDHPEETLSTADFLVFRPAVQAQAFPFEAIKIVNAYNLSVMPVVNTENHFEGIVTTESLFKFITENIAIAEPGAIIILEMEPRNYSLSEIARICESNDVSIIHLSIRSQSSYDTQQVMIKTNRTDIQALLATFERYSYQVTETFSADNYHEDLQRNYDALMHMINM